MDGWRAHHPGIWVTFICLCCTYNYCHWSPAHLCFSVLRTGWEHFPSAIPPQTTQAILRPLALLLGFEAGLLEYSLISVSRKDERQKEKKKDNFNFNTRKN